MAFDITKFQKKYKELTAEIKELRETIATWPEAKAQEISTAVLAAVTPLRNQVGDLTGRLATSNSITNQAAEILGMRDQRIRELETLVEQQRTAIAAHVEDHEALQASYDTVQPQIQLAEDKVQDLLAELKKHEDRMAEKHKREVAAIANRKLIAGAVPSNNRR